MIKDYAYDFSEFYDDINGEITPEQLVKIYYKNIVEDSKYNYGTQYLVYQAFFDKLYVGLSSDKYYNDINDCYMIPFAFFTDRLKVTEDIIILDDFVKYFKNMVSIYIERGEKNNSSTFSLILKISIDDFYNGIIVYPFTSHYILGNALQYKKLILEKFKVKNKYLDIDDSIDAIVFKPVLMRKMEKEHYEKLMQEEE